MKCKSATVKERRVILAAGLQAGRFLCAGKVGHRIHYKREYAERTPFSSGQVKLARPTQIKDLD